MANTILVAYATQSGSTVEVAERISQTLGANGASVEVKPISAVSSLDQYDAVVLGAPMILGWHRGATQWLVDHQTALTQKPTAIFMTCLELTRTDSDQVAGVAIFKDAQLGHAPKNAAKLNFKEKQTTPDRYVAPVLEQAALVKPVSVGIFGGKLDYSTLGLLSKLFVRLIIRGKAGDYRNWDAITAWADDVREQFAALS
ncbi:MAG: hypothetical protein JXA10_18850 [Anaerolineae bacterium]|nr:hypothetical protein [Anaerolineae bacterium]